MEKKYEEYLKQAEGFPALDWDAYTQAVASLHMPRFAELPDLHLYMDQLIEYVGQKTALFRVPGEKPITASMVNNYVKRHVVPQPQSKRYMPLHVAYLIVVVLLKRLYSMDDIERLIAFDVEHRFQAPQAYDKFIELFEASLKAQFLGHSEEGEPGGIKTVAVPGAFTPVVAEPDQLTHIDRMYLMAATSAAAKIYTEQVLVRARYQDALDALAREDSQAAQREQLRMSAREQQQEALQAGAAQPTPDALPEADQ
jgi:hypothetical protein